MCDGDAVEDCAGECGGLTELDECGECGGDGIDEGACDCDGNIEDCAGDCGGNAVEDDCGVCDGGNADMDCSGECFGAAEFDECGVVMVMEQTVSMYVKRASRYVLLLMVEI